MKRTRINPVSKRRQKEGAIYRKQRVAYLEAHPTCERCQSRRSRDIHHKSGRYGGNYLNEATWAALCRPCHEWTHQHPKEAREQGWLT